MNMHALLLHVLGDALGNVGVIATGLIIWLSDLSWKYYFDPIISLVITCIIFSSALPLGKFTMSGGIDLYFSLMFSLLSQKCFFHSPPGCSLGYFPAGS